MACATLWPFPYRAFPYRDEFPRSWLSGASRLRKPCDRRWHQQQRSRAIQSIGQCLARQASGIERAGTTGVRALLGVGWDRTPPGDLPASSSTPPARRGWPWVCVPTAARAGTHPSLPPARCADGLSREHRRESSSTRRFRCAWDGWKRDAMLWPYTATAFDYGGGGR
eukprot:COSAG01_NODE_533_length_15816_cov_4.518738_3_plen_168_part_00